METASESHPASDLQHWEEWLRNPQTAALSIAITARLLGSRWCQWAGETWLGITSDLLKPDSLCDSMCCKSALKHWAQELCRRRGWHSLARTDEGLCYVVALELSGYIFHVATVSGSKCPPRRWSRWLMRALVLRRIPGAVRMELRRLARTSEITEPNFLVDPIPVAPTAEISVCRCPEVVSVERMRVRPHYFSAVSLDKTPLEPDGLRIAQVTQNVTASGRSQPAHCDTITEQNSDLPFWPMPSDTRFKFSHRCALHMRGGTLEWSDWPQVSLSSTEAIAPLWRFYTGVFKRSTVDGVVHFNLISQTNWEIDWRQDTA